MTGGFDRGLGAMLCRATGLLFFGVGLRDELRARLTKIRARTKRQAMANGFVADFFMRIFSFFTYIVFCTRFLTIVGVKNRCTEGCGGT